MNDPVPGPPKTPILDSSIGLLSTGGDSSLLKELVELFLEIAPPQLASLATAVAAGDAETVRQEAHSLKGSAGALGATAIRDLAAEIEVVSTQGPLESAVSLIESTRQLVTQLEKEVTPLE